MQRETATCDECGSDYFKGTSEMMSLCAECSYVLVGYPACEHSMSEGRCQKCGWDGSRSKTTAYLMQRHQMSDEELKDELSDLKLKMETLERYQEVIGLANTIVTSPLDIVALSCEWQIEEDANSDDGLIDLKVLLNREMVVKLAIPNNRSEDIEHFQPALLDDYLDRASSSMSRQIDQILNT
jgi:hypothetical protein